MSNEKTVKIRLKEEYRRWRTLPTPESGNREDRHLVISSGKQPKAYCFDFRKKDEFDVPEHVAKLFTKEGMDEHGTFLRCVDPFDRMAGVKAHYPVEVVTSGKKGE